jgi:uncharacterized RDD family membrane protein YckC
VSDSLNCIDDNFLVGGVITRPCLAWVADIVLIASILLMLWWTLFWFCVLTFGTGFGAMAVLPCVPFCYHLFSLLCPSSATLGQILFGLTVCRNGDLGPPTGMQAVIFTVAFYATLASSGLLLIIALLTVRHRTLHDLLSGLVVIRMRAMEALTSGAGRWNIGSGSNTA